MSQPIAKDSWIATLGWAAYLACSWTWCIGMFLPVILLRDYGPWSFLAFAAPNVLGAAAFAWIVRSPARSEALLARHAVAVRVFSSITIAFQVYFACWLVATLAPEQPAARAAPALLLMPALLKGVSHRTQRAAALVLWTASALALASYLRIAGPPTLTFAKPPPDDLWPLVGVCVLGFSLCPYLDPTFHRVARAGTEPRQAFAVGFLVLFLAMILGTLVYAPALTDLRALRQDAPPLAILILLAFHVVPQLVFTIGVHAGESRRVPAPGQSQPWLAGAAVVVLCALPFFDPAAPVGSLTLGETGYRLFMAFYGLVFPAYVLIVMTCRHDGAGLRSGAVLLFALAVVFAAPCFWTGFIVRDTWWLWPGIGILLLARGLAALIPRG